MEDQRPRVLVVDDEQHIVEFVTMGLEGRGMAVRGAFDGHRALQSIDEFDPNVVVLDLMLPGLSGFEVAGRIRAKSGVPILMLSARGEVADKVRGLSLGADATSPSPSRWTSLRPASWRSYAAAGRRRARPCSTRGSRWILLPGR